MGPADVIGRRGEWIALTQLSQCRPGTDTPYLFHYNLDGKHQTFDFLVELVDAGESTPFFFVQVKTTRKGYTATQTPRRLRVEVSEADVRRMTMFPAPTYVVGVHEIDGRAYVIAVHGDMRAAIPSISTRHELTCETLQRLWDEVRAYWASRDMTRTESAFSN
jgi:hypothetical protein